MAKSCWLVVPELLRMVRLCTACVGPVMGMVVVLHLQVSVLTQVMVMVGYGVGRRLPGVTGLHRIVCQWYASQLGEVRMLPRTHGMPDAAAWFQVVLVSGGHW